MNRKLKRSKYDEYFLRNGDLAECKICFAKVSWTKNGGTNSIRLHLSSRHKSEMEKIDFVEYQSQRQMSLVEFPRQNDEQKGVPLMSLSMGSPNDNSLTHPTQSHPVGSWTGNSQHVSEIDRAVISLICQDGLPITMLQGNGFAKFLRLVAPKFQLAPTGHYVYNILPVLVSQIEDKIRFELSVASKLTLSVDVFEPEVSDKKFFAVHACYMNPETMTPKQILIDYKALPDRTENLPPDFYLSRISDLVDIHSKNTKIVYHEQFEPSETSPLPNFENILDEIVHEVFAEYTQLFYTQKQILISYNFLFKSQSKCMELIPYYGTSLTNEMMLSAKTFSWRQRKEILQLLLDTQTLNDLAKIENQQISSYLSENEYEVSKVMYKVLQEMSDMINSIHHTHYPTASVIIPTLRVLSCKMDDLRGGHVESTPTGQFLKKAKSTIEDKFVRCQNNMNLMAATFLDPRFRGRFFTEQYQSYIEHLALGAVYNEATEEDVKPSDMSSFDLFLKNQGAPTVKKETGNISKELEEYQNENPNSKTDPYEFWRLNESKFPILKSLAVEYMAIPALTFGAKQLSERGETICPLTEEKRVEHENFVYCYANMEQYGMY